ncbi:MAG: GNAT family N-acetyltransferase [Parachlamydiaceae bacterium]|nr:GNAT family N-acetyltransferase [Parachlamydiaceae bacterium]
MKAGISIRDYQPEGVQALANIYYNTIHRVNIQHYTQEQVDVWAPKSSVENTEGWSKKFSRTKPIIATVVDEIVGFAEFEPNGHIDCFYCHHKWIGKGVGSALMKEILQRAKNNHTLLIFSEVSITAKIFFEKWGFRIITQQTIIRNVELTNFKSPIMPGVEALMPGVKSLLY